MKPGKPKTPIMRILWILLEIIALILQLPAVLYRERRKGP